MPRIPSTSANDPRGGISQSRSDIGELISEIQRAEGISPDAATSRFAFLDANSERRSSLVSNSVRNDIEQSLRDLSNNRNLVARWASFVDGIQDGTSSANELIRLHEELITEEREFTDILNPSPTADDTETPRRNFIDYYGKEDFNGRTENLLKQAFREDVSEGINNIHYFSILTNLLDPSTRNSDLMSIWMRGIPTTDISRAVPFLRITVSQTAQSGDVIESSVEGSGNPNMSWDFNLEGAGSGGRFGGVAWSETRNPEILPRISSLRPEITGRAEISRGYINYPDSFIAPQTFLARGEVLDPTRPLMGIKNFSCKVQPTGYGLIATRTANLSLVLYDRSRMRDVAALISPAYYTTTNLIVEWGWKCELPESMHTPYTKLLNALNTTEIYTITSSSYNFNEDGTVGIELSMFHRSIRDLRETPIYLGSTSTGSSNEASQFFASFQRLEELRTRLERRIEDSLRNADLSRSVGSFGFLRRVASAESLFSIRDEDPILEDVYSFIQNYSSGSQSGNRTAFVNDPIRTEIADLLKGIFGDVSRTVQERTTRTGPIASGAGSGGGRPRGTIAGAPSFFPTTGNVANLFERARIEAELRNEIIDSDEGTPDEEVEPAVTFLVGDTVFPSGLTHSGLNDSSLSKKAIEYFAASLPNDDGINPSDPSANSSRAKFNTTAKINFESIFTQSEKDLANIIAATRGPVTSAGRRASGRNSNIAGTGTVERRKLDLIIARAMINAISEIDDSNVTLARMLAYGYNESKIKSESVSSSGCSGVWQQKPKYSGSYSDSYAEHLKNGGASLSGRALDRYNLDEEDLNIRIEESARIFARKIKQSYERYASETEDGNRRNLIVAASYNKGGGGMRSLWYNRGEGAGRNGHQYARRIEALELVYEGILDQYYYSIVNVSNIDVDPNIETDLRTRVATAYNTPFNYSNDSNDWIPGAPPVRRSRSSGSAGSGGKRARPQTQRTIVYRIGSTSGIGTFRNAMQSHLRERIATLFQPGSEETTLEEWKKVDPWLFDFLERHRGAEAEGEGEGSTRVDPFDGLNLNGKTIWDSDNSKPFTFVSLGRVFGFFVALPIAYYTIEPQKKYKEFQIFWQKFNSDAGWYANQPIANFLIEKEELNKCLSEAFYKKGYNISIVDFLNAIKNDIINNNASASWGLTDLFTTENERVVRRQEFREDSSLYNRRRDESLSRSYARFGRGEDNSVRFVEPNLIIMIDEKFESGRNILIPDLSSPPVLRATIMDQSSSRWTSLSHILRASRIVGGELPSNAALRDDDERDELVRETIKAITKETNGFVQYNENTNNRRFSIRGGFQRIKDVYRNVMPYMRYKGEGSLVTRASFSNIADSQLQTIHIQRTFNPNGLTPGSTYQSGLPMRVNPAKMSIEMLGLPFVTYAQNIFCDFDTGTSIDNIYAVNGVTLTISPGKFNASLELLIPEDAYGNYETTIGRLENLLYSAERVDGSPESVSEAIDAARALVAGAEDDAAQPVLQDVVTDQFQA